MPEVKIKARREWYPTDYQPESPLKSSRLSPEQELTLAIGQTLPGIIVEAFKVELGEPLKLDDVVYDFERYSHNCSSNLPDIAITLSPKWTAERETKMEALRDYILSELMSFIDHRCRTGINSAFYPKFDFMIKFVIECGVAINQQGKVTTTW